MSADGTMPSSPDAGGRGGWEDFWAGDHAIYVNPRHRQVHYARLARDLTALIRRRDRPLVLDWGCGDALNAPVVAEACSELMLYDAVPAVQQRLFTRFSGRKGIRVLDTPAWEVLHAASVDMIVLNSVAQYLGRDELGRVLDDFRRVLKPDGEVILADIIRPDAGLVADIAALLGPAARNGYLIAACVGLVKTFFSEYRRLRKTAGFSCYDETEFLGILSRHGFAGERLRHNVGFNRQRMTFRARPKT